VVQIEGISYNRFNLVLNTGERTMVGDWQNQVITKIDSKVAKIHFYFSLDWLIGLEFFGRDNQSLAMVGSS
jgi:hypothetical protein